MIHTIHGLPPSTACFLLGISLLATGCSRDPLPAKDERLPFQGQTLKVFNWSDYIDETLIPDFEKRTGAKVTYDKFSTEGELEAKLLVGNSGYDVVFPSDRSMSPLLKKNLLAEIDKSKLPNLKHMDPRFMNARYDPGNRYSVPYFWGTLAVGIRTDHVKEPVKGFEVLFDERYKGRIVMLDDQENMVAMAMLHLGYPMNSTEEAHLAKAKELLLKQQPLVQTYTSDAFKEKLIKGEAWVVVGWNGDILQAREEQASIKAIIPEAGTMIWVDSIAIPKTAVNAALAHEFINFLLDPEIAARNANAIKYATPNMAARGKIDPKILQDPAAYPSQQMIDKCQWLQDRGAEILKIERLWKEVKNK